MVVWTVIDEKLEWQECLSVFNPDSYLQMWEWGEYKSQSGWSPIRAVGYIGDDLKLMVQLLVRYYPFGFGIVWIPGGVIGKANLWAESILDSIKELTSLHYLIIKINDMRGRSNDDESLMESVGWSRSKNPLSTGLSLQWNLDQPENIIRSNLTKNWRHNLTRSGKKKLSFDIWDNPSVDDIFALYREMEQFKGLSQQFSYMEIKNLIEIMQDNLVLFRCIDANKQLVAIRACIIVEDKAWDVMAVTGSSARKSYASYGLFWELIKECVARGVKKYDLGGVDPSKNPGVWNFKKGTGAELIQYLGEWEYSNSQILLRIVNLVLKYKRV